MSHPSNASSPLNDHYATLDVSRKATEKELRLALRRAAETHPDKSSAATSGDEFKAVREAWEVLQHRRDAYDRELLAAENAARQRQTAETARASRRRQQAEDAAADELRRRAAQMASELEQAQAARRAATATMVAP